MRRISFMLMIGVLASTICATEPLDLFLGTWVNAVDATDVQVFLPASIGRDVDGGTNRYFVYKFPSDGQVEINHGGGNTAIFTYTLDQDELRLTDAAQVERIYIRQPQTAHPCARNLDALKGAKALFKIDHPDESHVMAADLCPAYLSEWPVCPDDGLYDLGQEGVNPRCSLEGHGID